MGNCLPFMKQWFHKPSVGRDNSKSVIAQQIACTSSASDAPQNNAQSPPTIHQAQAVQELCPRGRRLPLELQCELFDFLNATNSRRLITLSSGIATRNVAMAVRKHRQWEHLCAEYNEHKFKTCSAYYELQSCIDCFDVVRNCAKQVRRLNDRLDVLRAKQRNPKANKKNAETLKRFGTNAHNRFGSVHNMIIGYQHYLSQLSARTDDGENIAWANKLAEAYRRQLDAQYNKWAFDKIDKEFRSAKEQYDDAVNHWNLIRDDYIKAYVGLHAELMSKIGLH